MEKLKWIYYDFKKSPGWLVSKINRNNPTSITIECKSCHSIDFLRDIKNPKNIESLDLYGELCELDAIYRFTSLKKLCVDSSVSEKIDLSRFPLLESISAKDLKIFDNIDKQNVTELCLEGRLDYAKVLKFKHLKDLCIYQPKDIDFTRLESLDEIEHFQFTQGNIKSLKGIEKFINLKYLYMYYCRSLSSIHGIEQCPNLKTAFFESCGKIEDIEIIAKCPNLESIGIENYRKKDIEFVKEMKCKQTLKCLDIRNCGAISSLDFINEYSNLEALYFMDTNVLDGDITPCLRLQTAATFTKRHYNIKDTELPLQHGIRHWLPGA